MLNGREDYRNGTDRYQWRRQEDTENGRVGTKEKERQLENVLEREEKNKP